MTFIHFQSPEQGIMPSVWDMISGFFGSPVVMTRSGYLAVSILIVILYNVPPMKKRFLSYGVGDARAEKRTNTVTQQHTDSSRSVRYSVMIPSLDLIQLIRVPHSWFKHFYILSNLCLAFWLHQLASHGSVFKLVASRVPTQAMGMSVSQAALVDLAFAIHSQRRLYESIVLDKHSRSTMWIGHWIMGLVHYASISIAIWIEASPALLSDDWPTWRLFLQESYRRGFWLVPFVWCNVRQYSAHKYLFRLPSGSSFRLPSDGAFKKALCPHYGYEVGIYACLWALSGFGNKTMLCALIFVFTNLSVSARMRHEKYTDRFGEKALDGKKLMFTW